jgi:hypothetical protein
LRRTTQGRELIKNQKRDLALLRALISARPCERQASKDAKEAGFQKYTRWVTIRYSQRLARTIANVPTLPGRAYAYRLFM